jgi:hypothetical protein
VIAGTAEPAGIELRIGEAPEAHVAENPCRRARCRWGMDVTGSFQSRHSRRIVPMRRSQIASAFGLEIGVRSTSRPEARTELSRCLE